MAAVEKMANVTDPSTTMPGAFASFFGPAPVDLLGVVILTSLGTWGLPQMVHKFYAIKNEKAIRTGTIISTFFALVVAGGCYFLGGFGRLFSDQIDIEANGFDSVIPTMLSGLSDILIGVVVVLVLSASMSTLSSLVLTSSSTLTLDFISGTLVKKLDEKKKMLIMRLLIVFFISISVVIAIFQYHSSVTFIAQLGNLLGRISRSIFSAVHVWLILEAYNKDFRLGKFYFWMWNHDCQYACQTNVPEIFPVTDQLRSPCYDRRSGRRSAHQSDHAENGSGKSRRDIFLSG